MAEIKEVEMFLMIDENGDYVIATEEGNLGDAYDEDIDGGSDTARRIICVKLKVPLPQIVTLVASVPAEPEPSELTVQ